MSELDRLVDAVEAARQEYLALIAGVSADQADFRARPDAWSVAQVTEHPVQNSSDRAVMSKVFVNVGLSLDGYIAPEGMTMDRPEYRNWGVKWGALMAWIIRQQHFRDSLELGPGGETGAVNDLVRSTMERIGANVMGKRMFDQGEVAWPEEAPFHTPVYVLTHEKRAPWERPGGTTFYFINDGPERALELARESAGDRDVRISGGADVIQQYLNLGVIDELEIALAPVLFGGGRRLFDNLREPEPQFRIDSVLDGPAATHLRYVRR
jgi:dihydrofolate reductase